MREGWMIYIKSCVWNNLLKADFAPHTITVVLWDSRTSASQDKMIYSTKMKHTRSCSTNYSMSLSISLTQNEMHKIFSLGEFFCKVIFYEWGTMKNYTLQINRHNRHSVSVIIAVHRLIDSKNLKNKILLFRQVRPVHICQKPNPMSNSYIISFLFYVGLSIFTTFNNIFKWT